MSAPASSHHAAQVVAWEKLWRLLLAEDPPHPDPAAAPGRRGRIGMRRVSTASEPVAMSGKEGNPPRSAAIRRTKKAPAPTGADGTHPDRDSRKDSIS